jgi:hypothetical protein
MAWGLHNKMAKGRNVMKTALEALKLIKMPKPQSVAGKVASKGPEKPSSGDRARFIGTDVANKRNHLISKGMGAGVVGRSVVARSADKGESKQLSKARSVLRVYDAADPATKREILKCAVGTALKNTPNNFREEQA